VNDIIKEVFEWDVVNWSKAAMVWEEKIRTIGAGKRALEIGGKRGGPSLWLAKKGLDVVCSDLENPEEDAAQLHNAHQVNVRYEAINALEIPYENHFDVVVFKSVLGGIGRNDQFSKQQQTMDQLYNALKPGGVLLFAENLSGSGVHRFARKHFIKWGDSWRYLDRKEMETLLTPFSTKRIETTGFLGAFGRNEAQRRFLGKLDQAILNNLVPSSWQYIAYGWAVK
jgi:SAM-dependent methyltransferase